MKTYNRITVYFVLFIVLGIIRSQSIDGYNVEPPGTVHQYLTNESKIIWKATPFETKQYTDNPFENIYDLGYQNSDDAIDGSGEEDTPPFYTDSFSHFWNPDNPRGGNYSDGLNLSYEHESSYRKALGYWTTKVIPHYISGDTEKSYYWLGRVAHLLEDAASSAHTHEDPHPIEDSLEDYTGNTFRNWKGSDYKNQQYNYESPQNMQSFNWQEVEPTDALAKRNLELFRLFWYTTQKTQYFASDDSDGNSVYYDLNNQQKPFSINLWQGDNVQIISDKTQVSSNISKIANATIPHAMRAVAGLYRLFDDAVRIDWPTPEHDYRRTSFTLLKGDMPTASAVEKIAFVVQKNVTKEQVLKPVVADVDGNGAMETVTAVHDFKIFNPQVDLPVNRTDIYAVEIGKTKKFYENGYKPDTKKKWNITLIEPGPGGGAIYYAPTLANIDANNRKEVITGVRNGTIYVYNISADGKTATQRWKYKLRTKYAPIGGESIVFFTGGTAVADLDLDGKNEIIFADVDDFDEPSWPGEVYVLKDNGFGVQPTKFANYTFGNGGAYAPISIANVDADDNPEIIVPSFYGIYVLDYNPSVPNKLSLKWNNAHGKIESSPVVADVDGDNQYELVYTTSTQCAQGKTCFNRTYIVDALNGSIETQINIQQLPRPTPAVGNLDADADLEIALLTQQAGSVDEGGLHCFNAVGGTPCSGSWPFDLGGHMKVSFMSPSIADIDGDGNNDIVFGESETGHIFVVKNDGTQLFNYSFDGTIDNGIAIADVDQDGVAELTLKRASSPPTLLSSISSFNNQPALEPAINVTAIAGDIINITKEAALVASDPDNNNLTFVYSSPFNASGLWQTNANDTGNYSVIVEISDGNLTDFKYVDLIVFDAETKLVNTFNDSTTEKEIAYSSSGNQTAYIRLPKNATVVYSKITLRGKAP